MRRAGPQMARVQRRPSYAEAVLALKPSFYTLAQVPGGRMDFDSGQWDLTGHGNVRIDASGVPIPVLRSIAPGLGHATAFISSWWRYPGLFNTSTQPFAIAMWCTEDSVADLTRSNLISKNTSGAAYPDVDFMIWLNTGASPPVFTLTSITGGGVSQDQGAVASQEAARIRAHHLVVVKPAGGSSQSYMAQDGVAGIPAVIDTVDTGGGSIRIGGNAAGFWREWGGSISDVAIWFGPQIPTLDVLAALYGLGNGGSSCLSAS